jgi:two-component system cell cycle response regulator
MGVAEDEWDDETGTTDLESMQSQAGGDDRRACLTILTGTAAGQMFKCGKAPITLGRSPQAELRLDDDGISRNHARIRSETGKSWVEDLSSRNGTFVNGERITGGVELKDGDKIQVGRGTVLRFGFQDALDESFHENLLSSALRDGLTKLFNKRYLMDRLDSELKFAQRHETSLSLLLLDIDHFKKVNDTHGHPIGDEVLRRVAGILGASARKIDIVARYGGEEFAIVLEATDRAGARQLAERIRADVSKQQFKSANGSFQVTLSLGVAGYPEDATAKEIIIARADESLYAAKHGGRNQTVCAADLDKSKSGLKPVRKSA